MKQEKVDAAVWLLPDAADRETAARLRDSGIEFIGINIGEVTGPPARYEVRRRRAMDAIFREWAGKTMLSAVTIVQTRGESASDAGRLPVLRALAEAQTLRCNIATVPPGGISPFLKRLCADGDRGLVLPGPAAAMLAWAGGGEIEHIVKSCPVALLDGAMDLPLAHEPPPGRVDLVTVNWQAVAKRIALEIENGEAFRKAGPTAFEAEHHLRVSLRDGSRRSRNQRPRLATALASLSPVTQASGVFEALFA